jgi:hypothetical protein
VVVRRRRLRKLVPDAELVRRRAAGETFRDLAPDYGVAHTTLVRYFERPEVVTQVKDAVRQLCAEERVLADRRSAERRRERELRREAKAQAAREREYAHLAPARQPGANVRRRAVSDPYESWLDEHDARTPLARAEQYSQSDREAAVVVAGGGGLQAVIDATGLRTIDNVVRLVDPAILRQALDNDVLRNGQPSGV